VKAAIPKRNLTLSLPVELIRQAKVIAAQRGVSLNALVQDSLQRTAQREDGYMAAGRRILAASERGLYSLKKASWKREELHD
jgi:hypothetical protein